jgi:hypothetical protein
MVQKISDETIKKIRYYVRKYNSKIDVANKLGLSYDTVLFYTKDIRIRSRKIDIEYSGVYGKSLDLLKELLLNDYVFCSEKYGLKEYIKLKKDFPQIRRTKMYGRMIYYMSDKSKIAAQALLKVSNKKVMSYQELKQVKKIFDTNFSKEEKTHYFKGENDGSLAFFCIRRYCILTEKR